MKILVGLLLAYAGHIIYVASLETIGKQIIDTGKRDVKHVWLIVLGLMLCVIGGSLIGHGFITI